MNHPTAVLLVESSDSDANLIQLLLSHAGFVFERVASLRDAITAIHTRHRDVILLDHSIHLLEDRTAIQRLRVGAPDSPIVVLSGDADESVALESITEGAQEFLSKEHMIGQLLVRTIRHSIARQQQLQEAQDQALTDALTGLGNRRLFDRELARRLTGRGIEKQNVIVSLFDIDHFKSVNDRYGHEKGDLVLCNVALTLRQSLDEADVVTRFGGEEFGILQTANHFDQALELANRAQQAIAALNWSEHGLSSQLTISGGIARMFADDKYDTIVRRADEALYSAKANGRNCCYLHDGAQCVPAATFLGNSRPARGLSHVASS